MRPNARLAFSLFIALLAAGALLETRGWSLRTALFPRVTAVPLLALAVVESLMSLRGREDEAEQAEPMDFAATASVPAEVAARRTVVSVAWILGFFLAVVLLGFQVATPLFVFAYLKGRGREGWFVSLTLPAVAALVFHLLFVRMLHVPLPQPLLWQVLTR